MQISRWLMWGASVATLLLACSSSERPLADTGGDEATPGNGGGDPSTDGSAPARPDVDASSVDAHADARADGTTDGAIDALSPLPPAGAVPCGKGTFTAADSKAACNTVPVTSSPRAKSCEAVSLAGGAYEAWCTSTELYLWARFDAVALVASPAKCLYLGASIDPAVHVGATGELAAGSTTKSTQIDRAAAVPARFSDLSTAATTIVATSTTQLDPLGPNGTVKLWLTMVVDGGSDCTRAGPSQDIGGLAVAWSH